MSKLGDLVRGIIGKQTTDKIPQASGYGIKCPEQLYNDDWLEQISHEFGYTPSGNENRVQGILKALNSRNGQCPCGGSGLQYKCPCDIMRNQSICKCGLFVTEIVPQQKTVVKKIEHNK